jgi:hypothetical protein
MIVAVLAILALTTCSAAAYVAPLLVAIIRRVPDVGAVAVVNLLLGWTFVGWVLALAMALRSADPGRPTVQIVQNMPPGGWPEPVDPRPPWAAPPLMLPPADGPGQAGWDQPADWQQPTDWQHPAGWEDPTDWGQRS